MVSVAASRRVVIAHDIKNHSQSRHAAAQLLSPHRTQNLSIAVQTPSRVQHGLFDQVFAQLIADLAMSFCSHFAL
jgi:hypothetical protein